MISSVEEIKMCFKWLLPFNGVFISLVQWDEASRANTIVFIERYFEGFFHLAFFKIL